jgi:hypothetical protein
MGMFTNKLEVESTIVRLENLQLSSVQNQQRRPLLLGYVINRDAGSLQFFNGL